MRVLSVFPWCLAALLAAAVATAAEGTAGGEASGPSLEYRPPRSVLPEPKAPTPAPPLTIFRQVIGGFGINSGSFDRPIDVVFDKDDNLLVLDTGNNRVQLFDVDGNFVFSWGAFGSRPGEFSDPRAIGLDKTGFLYVVDTGNHRIQKCEIQTRGAGQCSSGRTVETTSSDFQVCVVDVWGSLGSRSGRVDDPEDRGALKDPSDITFDGSGNCYVVDTGNERVVQYDISESQARYKGEFGRAFSQQGGSYDRLKSIAWSDERFGYIYLFGGDCLAQQFEMDGRFVQSWSAVPPESEQCAPARIRSNNDERHLYLLDEGNGLLMRFTRDGRFLTAMRGAERPFSKPGGFCLNPSRGDVAVADTESNIVQKFTLR